MAFSYSFHLSNKANALTNVQKIMSAEKHNLRRFKSKEYDKSKNVQLRGSDSILDDVKQIYHREFDDCLQAYNKGRRADRQINDYLNHVSEGRGDAAAEIIIQVGDMEFWQKIKENHDLEQIKKDMTPLFESQIQKLEYICPDFKIASATIHFDEKSPHMHVIGVPVASGYSKGMEKQVAKTKVFTKSSLATLQNEMRIEAMRSMRYIKYLSDMSLKEKEDGRNRDIPKYYLSDYYAEKEELQTEIQKLDMECIEKSDLSTTLGDEISAQKALKGVLDTLDPEKSLKIENTKDFGIKKIPLSDNYMVNAEFMEALMQTYEYVKGLEKFEKERIPEIIEKQKITKEYYGHAERIKKRAEKEVADYKAEHKELIDEVQSLRDERKKLSRNIAEYRGIELKMESDNPLLPCVKNLYRQSKAIEKSELPKDKKDELQGKLNNAIMNITNEVFNALEQELKEQQELKQKLQERRLRAKKDFGWER